jgi:hypothetical protein
MSERLAALEKLDDTVNINRACIIIRNNVNISVKASLGRHNCELKEQKPWIDKDWSKLLDPKKRPQLHWLQN